MPALNYSVPMPASVRELREHYRGVAMRLRKGEAYNVFPIACVEPIEAKEPRTIHQMIRSVCAALTDVSSCADIVVTVAREWRIPYEAMMNDGPNPFYFAPRGIAIALCYRITQLTLEKLSLALGDRHHTTILHAERKYGAMIDAAFAKTATVFL